jgi:hypothetical protein
MRHLVIPDVHEKVKLVTSIIEQVQHDRRIFTGDFFDDKKYPATSSIVTAKWLRKYLYDPASIVLCGNHDASYMFSQTPRHIGMFSCSGFSDERKAAIDSVFTQEDWKRFRGVHNVGNVVFTHAGLSSNKMTQLYALSYIEQHTFKDGDEFTASISKAYDIAVKAQDGGVPHPLFDCGWIRHGPAPTGGITWCDSQEFEPIEGFIQVHGHNRVDPSHVYLRLKTDKAGAKASIYMPERDSRIYDRMFKNGMGIGIDSHMNGFGVLDDTSKTFEVHQIEQEDNQMTSSKLIWALNYETLKETMKVKSNPR